MAGLIYHHCSLKYGQTDNVTKEIIILLDLFLAALKQRRRAKWRKNGINSKDKRLLSVTIRLLYVNYVLHSKTQKQIKWFKYCKLVHFSVKSYLCFKSKQIIQSLQIIETVDGKKKNAELNASIGICGFIFRYFINGSCCGGGQDYPIHNSLLWFPLRWIEGWWCFMVLLKNAFDLSDVFHFCWFEHHSIESHETPLFMRKKISFDRKKQTIFN